MLTSWACCEFQNRPKFVDLGGCRRPQQAKLTLKPVGHEVPCRLQGQFGHPGPPEPPKLTTHMSVSKRVTSQIMTDPSPLTSRKAMSNRRGPGPPSVNPSPPGRRFDPPGTQERRRPTRFSVQPALRDAPRRSGWVSSRNVFVLRDPALSVASGYRARESQLIPRTWWSRLARLLDRTVAVHT